MKKDNFHVLAAWFSLGTLALALFFMGIVFYWLVVPYNVIEIKEPIDVIGDTFEHGEVLLHEVEYCKNVGLPAKVINRITDGEYGYIYEAVSADASTGCGKVISSRLVIPDSVPYSVAKWKMQLILVYQVNPFRTETYQVESEPFYIREKK